MEGEKLVQTTKIGDFQLNKIQITGNGEDQSLNIQLQHYNSLEIYDVTITFEDMKKNVFLDSYESLEELKITLTNDLDKLRISDTGDLTYKVQPKKRLYQVVFPAKRRDINHCELLVKRLEKNVRLKMQDLELRMTNLINQKTDTLATSIAITQKLVIDNCNLKQNLDQQIASLQKNVKDLKDQNQQKFVAIEIKTQNNSDRVVENEKKLAVIQDTIAALTANITCKRDELQKLKCQTSETINNLRCDFQSFKGISNNTIKSLRYDVQSNLNYDIGNPLSSFFSLKRNLNSLSITHLGDYNWRTYVRSIPVPANAVSSYSFKQIKSTCNQIHTRTLQSFFQSKQCLVYYTAYGAVWNGEHNDGGRPVKDGQVISMEVNTTQWNVKWSVGQQKLVQWSIPEQMRNKVLYVVVLMCGQNDMVELLD